MDSRGYGNSVCCEFEHLFQRENTWATRAVFQRASIKVSCWLRSPCCCSFISLSLWKKKRTWIEQGPCWWRLPSRCPTTRKTHQKESEALEDLHMLTAWSLKKKEETSDSLVIIIVHSRGQHQEPQILGLWNLRVFKFSRKENGDRICLQASAAPRGKC